MIAIFKREIKNYLKRPLFWIGMALVIYGVFSETSPYLTTHYIEPEEKVSNSSDAGVYEGEGRGGRIRLRRDPFLLCQDASGGPVPRPVRCTVLRPGRHPVCGGGSPPYGHERLPVRQPPHQGLHRQ